MGVVGKEVLSLGYSTCVEASLKRDASRSN